MTSWLKQRSKDTEVCLPGHFQSLPNPVLLEKTSNSLFWERKKRTHVCIFMCALILCYKPKYLKLFLWPFLADGYLGMEAALLPKKEGVHFPPLMTGICTGHWIPSNNGAAGNSSGCSDCLLNKGLVSSTLQELNHLTLRKALREDSIIMSIVQICELRQKELTNMSKVIKTQAWKSTQNTGYIFIFLHRHTLLLVKSSSFKKLWLGKSLSETIL